MPAFSATETLTRREIEQYKPMFQPFIDELERAGHTPFASVFNGQVNGLGWDFPIEPQPTPYAALDAFNVVAGDPSKCDKLAKYLLTTGRVKGR